MSNMAQLRQSGMTNDQTGTPGPLYEQSVFSVPLKPHSVVPTMPVPSRATGFVSPQILYPGALPVSFPPIVPASSVTCVAQQRMISLQSAAAFPYPYATSTGMQNVPHKAHSPQDAQARMEDRKKFDKERQFQLQQQKLKQFSSSGVKPKLNSDTLIQNMFGKTEKKVVRASSQVNSEQPVIPTQAQMPATKPKQIKESPSVEVLPVENKKTDKTKNLDHMMQQCSDLTGPQKARTFQKPAVKDVRKIGEHLVPPSYRPAFNPSQKSRDWRCVQGLEDVFMLPRPRFPAWCSEEWVPPLYRQIEQHVTSNGQQEVETSRLYSVFLLSGLPREVLGHIWNLVNTTTPGQLTREELYAMLALIAVVQSGCPVSSTDILHSLPRPPIPSLSQQQPSTESSAVDANISTSLDNQTKSKPGVDAVEDDFGEFCSIATENMPQNVPHISSPLQNQSISSCDNEDFDEFQQAAIITKESEWTATQNNISVNILSENSIQNNSSSQVNLFNPQTEDKYAAFKEIDEQSERTSNETNSVNALNNSGDDFGDFLCANTNVPPVTDTFDGLGTSRIVPATEDFADFDSFKSAQSSTPVVMEDNIANNDDDFGDFASSQQTFDSLTVESCSRGFQKDNISLGETQSICSLDLGPYVSETVTYNSEGLTRQGSILSLDLRSSALNDGENGISDEVGNVSTIKSLHQASPPSHEEVNLSGTSSFKGRFPTRTPLIDKYSFIRHETESVVVEDKLCSEWLKCLSSCHELLQNAKHIFDQMSNNQVMSEVLTTEEGQDYVKNVIEVYRVAERIQKSSAAVGKQNDDLNEVFSGVKQAWTHLTSFLVKTSLMPGAPCLSFSSALSRSENNSQVATCGVCLQNNLDQDKLIYGSRQYHSTCANLWVNCVDLLLPALTVPHLL